MVVLVSSTHMVQGKAHNCRASTAGFGPAHKQHHAASHTMSFRRYTCGCAAGSACAEQACLRFMRAKKSRECRR